MNVRRIPYLERHGQSLHAPEAGSIGDQHTGYPQGVAAAYAVVVVADGRGDLLRKAELRMAELRRLDAGRHKGPHWAGEQIPELGDVCAAVRGRLLVNVEVKCGAAAVPALARCVTEHDMADAVIVSSFDQAVVRAVTAQCPSLLAGLRVDHPVPDPVAAARAGGAQLLHVKHTYLTPALVELLHQAELGALAWTVNAPDEIRCLAALGVDAILSDDPRRLRTIVG